VDSRIEPKAPHAECWKCPLVAHACAPTSGPTNAKIAFVSRSPGKHDIAFKKPFAGPSGKVLDHLLGRYGVKRDEIITTNVVLCRTDDPPVEAIQACRPRLEAEIANCELVIAGGTEATTALTRYRTVFNARPFIHNRTSRNGTKQRVIVTNNPALVIRDSDSYPDIVEDFRRAFDPPPPVTFPTVEIINEQTRARDVLRKWNKTVFDTPIASDLEWNSNTDEPVCAGFSKRVEKAIVFGYGAIASREVRQELRKFYTRPDLRFVWHNGKSDTKVLRKSGIWAHVDEDTFLMSYVLDERPGYHRLEYLLSSRFGWPDYEPKSVKEFKKAGEFSGKTPQERRRSEYELYKYNGWDCAGTFLLFQDFSPRLDTDRGGSVRQYYKRLLHAGERFTTVELNGFNYDTEEALNVLDRAAIPAMIDLRGQIREISGRALINPNSPMQMAVVYYDDFGLVHKLRDTGKKKFKRSTGVEVRTEILQGRAGCNIGKQERLLRLAEAHQTWAKITKLRGNYLEGLILRVGTDNKLYCNFNLGGTVSGRTSSSDPNFQNIAREGYAEIPGIRTLFTASPGHVIISADYSQAELRTCAKLSGDVNLLSIYRDSARSLHKERAAAFYGENYTKEEYVKSKNINFGVTYGQGADAFAQMYHMPKAEAQAYIDNWWLEFPTLKEWVNETQRRALREGFVLSPFGHKRRFSLITDDNREEVKREAVNTIPQNVAAWLTICALCDLVDNGVCVVATVHDSIVADVPLGEVDATVALMHEIMIKQPLHQLGWDDIPFGVDISTGPNWGSLEEMELKSYA